MMDKKQGPKGDPRISGVIRIGDDDGDDEATVLEISRDAVREVIAARRGEGGQHTQADGKPAKRAPPPSVAEDDPEKTEMFERPDLSDSKEGQAPRGVVALGADAEKLLGKTGRADGDPALNPAIGDDSDEGETMLLTRPSPSTARALDKLAPPVSDSEPSDERTATRPKVARVTVESSPSSSGAPAPRPLPPPPSSLPRDAETSEPDDGER